MTGRVVHSSSPRAVRAADPRNERLHSVYRRPGQSGRSSSLPGGRRWEDIVGELNLGNGRVPGR